MQLVVGEIKPLTTRNHQIVWHNAEKVPSWLVCGSYDPYIECMLSGIQITAGLEFFLSSSHLCNSEDCDSLL